MSFQKSATSLRSRLHLGDIHPALIIGIIVIAIIVVIAALVVLGQTFDSPSFTVTKSEDTTEEMQEVTEVMSPDAQENATAEGVALTAAAEEATQPLICVYVSGCVMSPNVYYVNEGARVVDAIQAAGGFAENAATEAINLARVLTDGEQILVYSLEEVESSGTSLIATQTPETQSPSSATSQEKININTADSTQLQILNGIGEATAEKIIAYREANGAFSAIEDIKQVSGIGDKKFEAIKDDICVN